jgi:TolB-like protein
VGRSSQGGLFEVTICANLVRFDPDDPRFGLPPTLAVFPWASLSGSIEIDGRPASPRGFAQQLENAVQRTALQSNRFQVLDERNAADLQRYRNEIVARAERGMVDEMELVKIGKALTADFVLTGEIERLAIVDKTAPTPSHRRVDLRMTARLVNVADGRIVWEDSEQLVLDGRTLALARSGRQANNQPVEDASERTLDPADLALLRASRAMQSSLQSYLESLPRRGREASSPPEAPATTAIAVVRVASGRVTFESVPGLAVGDRYAIENPVEIVLGDGRKLEDVDRIAVVRIVEIGPQLSKAEVVEGDAKEIAAGRSRMVRIP